VNEDHRMAEDNYSSYNDTVECSEIDTLQSVSNDMQSVTPPSLHHCSALFILGLKVKFKLPQVAIQGIIEGVTNLTQHQNNLLKSQVQVTSTLSTM